jgi:hypothetical protein
MHDIRHCFIRRRSDSTVSEDAGVEPGTVATTALAVRRSKYTARSHPHPLDHRGFRMIVGGRVERLIETSVSSVKQDISGKVNERLLGLVARNQITIFCVLSEDYQSIV